MPAGHTCVCVQLHVHASTEPGDGAPRGGAARAAGGTAAAGIEPRARPLAAAEVRSRATMALRAWHGAHRVARPSCAHYRQWPRQCTPRVAVRSAVRDHQVGTDGGCGRLHESLAV